MDIAIIITYTLALLIIFLYSLAQLNLLLNYLKSRKEPDNSPTFDFSKSEEIPNVTVQLPVFNELYVMERLLDNIAELEYPKDKLEIQVLDDSTDESVVTTAAHIEKLRETGLDIKHICREDRSGFKAGALKEGLKIAKGEYIAIFDADFLPGKKWLLQTIPYFKDSGIGVVQTRWGHINRDYSMLTKIQAFALDFHFTMEQVGRNFKDHFINFNGTAGVWRKSCIEDAGNWQGDTLTEDLDLSYRAQLKKWKFKYLEEVETPAELPVVISAARSQQFRWNKGAAENFQKLYWKLLKDKTVPLKTKFHSFFHLLNSSMFLLVLLVAVLSVPVMYVKNSNPMFSWYFNVIAFFALSTVIFFFCYWYTFKKIHGKGFWNFMEYIKMFFTFFSIAMGFSVHNSMAVLEGHFGKKSEFVRTPKFNINSLKDSWKDNKYINKNISGNTIIEALLMGYFGFALYSAFKLQDFGLFLFHIMLFLGFGFVFFKSVTSKL
ncbi:cellulose synthase family protein [Aquimarina sp. 2201CG5-10]|uniref:cellulose synthase family protein n=1 Tax=Aquimarina callyspongiae TaxID=3098150 RepID=UPI002AB5DBCD|nr:cellulose synthase family protein [Aquimarina sp. 2201CG5-10]MDY8134780.1 cellulose synthase family protein [Aquimarina sp. 2201CG5-10]